MNERDMWDGADVRRILVQCTRGRRFYSHPPHPVLEKRGRTNQPDPSRNPLSNSGLLGCGAQRRRRDRAHPRMPDLEGAVHVTALFVDPS